MMGLGNNRNSSSAIASVGGEATIGVPPVSPMILNGSFHYDLQKTISASSSKPGQCEIFFRCASSHKKYTVAFALNSCRNSRDEREAFMAGGSSCPYSDTTNSAPRYLRESIPVNSVAVLILKYHLVHMVPKNTPPSPTCDHLQIYAWIYTPTNYIQSPFFELQVSATFSQSSTIGVSHPDNTEEAFGSSELQIKNGLVLTKGSIQFTTSACFFLVNLEVTIGEKTLSCLLLIKGISPVRLLLLYYAIGLLEHYDFFNLSGSKFRHSCKREYKPALVFELGLSTMKSICCYSQDGELQSQPAASQLPSSSNLTGGDSRFLVKQQEAHKSLISFQGVISKRYSTHSSFCLELEGTHRFHPLCLSLTTGLLSSLQIGAEIRLGNIHAIVSSNCEFFDLVSCHSSSVDFISFSSSTNDYFFDTSSKMLRSLAHSNFNGYKIYIQISNKLHSLYVTLMHLGTMGNYMQDEPRYKNEEDLKSLLSEESIVQTAFEHFTSPITKNKQTSILFHDEECPMESELRNGELKISDLATVSMAPEGVEFCNGLICLAEMLPNGILRLRDETGTICAVCHTILIVSAPVFVCFILKAMIVHEHFPGNLPSAKYLLLDPANVKILEPSRNTINSIGSPMSKGLTSFSGFAFEKPLLSLTHGSCAQSVLHATMEFSCCAEAETQRRFTLFIHFRNSYLTFFHLLSKRQNYRFTVPLASFGINNSFRTLEWSSNCNFEFMTVPDELLNDFAHNENFLSVQKLFQICHTLDFDTALVSVQGAILAKEFKARKEKEKNGNDAFLIKGSLGGIDLVSHPKNFILLLSGGGRTFRIFFSLPVPVLGLTTGRYCRLSNISLRVQEGYLSGTFLPSSYLSLVEETMVSPPARIIENRCTTLLAELLSNNLPRHATPFIIVMPLQILHLHISLNCTYCELENTTVSCSECSEQTYLKASCEMLVSDGSLEFVALLPNFELIQTILRLDTERVRDDLKSGRIERKFQVNERNIDNDGIQDDWLSLWCSADIWKRSYIFKITHIPGHLKGLLPSENPSAYIRASHFKARVFKNLNRDSEVSLAPKFVQITIMEVRALDAAMEAFSIIKDL